MQKHAIYIDKARLVAVNGRTLTDLFRRSQAIWQKSEVSQISTYPPVRLNQLVKGLIEID